MKEATVTIHNSMFNPSIDLLETDQFSHEQITFDFFDLLEIIFTYFLVLKLHWASDLTYWYLSHLTAIKS